MASYEQKAETACVDLSNEDISTLQGRQIELPLLVDRLNHRTLEFCKGQQSILQEQDGECGISATVSKSEIATQVEYSCDKFICPDRSICTSFAARTILRRINTETQFRRQFKR